MADIPGIQFGGSPGIDRSRLAGANERPRMEYGSLSWPTADGSTSASPVARLRTFEHRSPAKVEELARWVWEGLELPGEASDYHFLLQGAVEQLWSRRREDPNGLRFVETFGYLDLALIEAAPQAVKSEHDPAGGFFRITTLQRLMALLEREGALREALALSRRVARFGDHYGSEDLEAKAAALDVELR